MAMRGQVALEPHVPARFSKLPFKVSGSLCVEYVYRVQARSVQCVSNGFRAGVGFERP